MDNSTISIIRRWISENPEMNNSELAREIHSRSTLNLSVGSLQNYIAKVKKLDNKVVSTQPGHIMNEREKTKEDNINSTYPLTPKETYPVTMSIHDHIKGYLISFPETNFVDLAQMMQSNNVGTEYSLGTLRNYISRGAKDIQVKIDGSMPTSSDELYSKVKEADKQDSSIGFDHLNIITIVDQALVNSGYLQDFIDHSEELSELVTNTLCSFAEAVNIHYCTMRSTYASIQREDRLGIKLYDAIHTTIMSALTKINKLKDYCVVNIVTSGYDNGSNFLVDSDISDLFTRLSKEFGWTINLIYLKNNETEAINLGQKLGIDSSNVMSCSNDGYIVKEVLIRSFNKKLNQLRNKDVTALKSFS
jgi:hypothetical protein